MGPSNSVKCYNGYYVNGFKFHTQFYGRYKKTMNSGVCVKGSCYNGNEIDYYGMLEEVIRLKYLGSKCKVFMFKCHWYDTKRGLKVHRSNGLVEIKHTSRLHGSEDFVLAQQCQQVYYTCPPDNKSSEWWAVMKTTARSRYNVEMGEFIENNDNVKTFDVDQLDEISQPCCVLPNMTLDEPSIFVDTSYYEEVNQNDLLTVEGNWGDDNEMDSDEEIEYDNEVVGDDDNDDDNNDDLIRSDDDDD
jgi:hypothetical protein